MKLHGSITKFDVRFTSSNEITAIDHLHKPFNCSYLPTYGINRLSHGTSDSIKRSMSVLEETANVGSDIAAELQRSREKIESAAARVGVSSLSDWLVGWLHCFIVKLYDASYLSSIMVLMTWYPTFIALKPNFHLPSLGDKRLYRFLYNTFLTTESKNRTRAWR